MLCMADATGMVASALPGIARRANVSLEAAEKALKIFMEPDPYSKDPEHDGRRVERIPGGYMVLNYLKYRQHDLTGYERLKRFRERHRNLNSQPAAPEEMARAKKEKPQGAAFAQFWEAYPKKVGRGEAEKAWRALAPDAALLQLMLAALAWQSRQDQWTRDGNRFVPNPSTWLSQKRWLDERPAAGSGRPSLGVGAPRPPEPPADKAGDFLRRLPEELQPLRPDFERYYATRAGGAELEEKLLRLFAGQPEFESNVSIFLGKLKPVQRTAETARRIRLNLICGQYGIPELP